MKIKLPIFLILVICLASPAEAQKYEYRVLFHSIENGLDDNFFGASSFGVRTPIYSAYPVSGMIRHNRVDGLFFGYKEDRMRWTDNKVLGLDDVNIHGMLGYSFGQQEVQYTLGLDKKIGNDFKWLMLGAEYYNTTSTEDHWRSGIYENAVSSFTAGLDYHDYYNVTGFGFYSLLRIMNNLELGISYNENQYNSLNISSDYALFSRYAVLRPNPAIDASTDQIGQQSVTLGFTINPDEISTNSFLWITLSAKAELADAAGLKNEFRYNSYLAEAKTYLRLDRSSLLKWRVMAGSITGVAPDFKNFALGGIGTMRAYGYKFMRGNEMLLNNLELEFGRKSKKHHHSWADLSAIHVSVFLDSGFSQENESLYMSANPLDALGGFKLNQLTHNAGVGIGTGIFRFEVATPIAGEDGDTAFWIRMNPIF